ncbi:MATE family efflux transporter [Paenibacillus sp. alder61]|uniref:MATE family efflux transporter n=1 Tax=Paenibacillus faecis TaxID=862114 RepID=A0A5D0CNM5_9BACL|nr:MULTISPECIES: MATE family efflux transporter [Paenibacillus]MCA1292605.1 MATE family efflux transporter [Paenibacillus sp. alder61]TYA11649.1 MATE family efflux transporter [Paenibacillus faecis]
MKKNKGSEKSKFSLWLLAWPIFIEQFLQFLLGSVDTLMVSRISDNAVAVVGFSNQLFNALTTLFATVASGAGIVIAQKIGSRKEEDARTVGIIAFNATGAIGLGLSILLIALPRPIARILQLPEELLPLAEVYISIVGGGMILTALMAVLSTAIRNTGNTKGPMMTAIGMNVIHIVMNYGFIFGAFGFPQWGLTGVAISTVVSRLLATIVLFVIFLGAFHRKIERKDFALFDRKLFKEILVIGWPLGVNSASWVFSQLAIFSFLAVLGSTELAARTYMNTLESFCFLLGFSLALAAQIQIAHLYGAGRTKEAYQAVFKVLAIGLPLVIVNAFILVVFGHNVLGLFTKDQDILALCGALLWLNLLLQPGKMVNMAIGNSLNAVGDTRYTMNISLIFMWVVATGCSYWLGVSLGYGIIAIYSCMIADEYIRAVLSFLRWRERKFLRMKEADMERTRTGDPAICV